MTFQVHVTFNSSNFASNQSVFQERDILEKRYPYSNSECDDKII